MNNPNPSAPAQLPHPWSKEALLPKAQRYAEEMLTHDRDDWKFAFWSSLTLEMLARSALGNMNPVLLADNKDHDNLYYALGHTPKTKKFVPKSTGISSVFNRLQNLLPDFDISLEGFGVLHMSRRNEEVHSGSNPFDNMGSAAWLPLFYQTSEALLRSMNETLEFLFGPEEADIALTLIKAAKDESAKAVAKNIQTHKAWWNLQPESERKQLRTQATLWATKQLGHRVLCPACDSHSLIFGTPAAAPQTKLKEGLIIETQTFLPSKFECVACKLKVSGLAQLHACGLGDTYKSTSTYDPVDYYASSDDYSGYEEDNNEP